MASFDRGNARNVIPKAFTKHAAARALVSAKTAKATMRINSRNGLAKAADWKNAWKIMSSLTKPLKGGSAEIETAPIRNSSAVVGIRLINPPISSMFRVSVAFTMEPEVMKRRLLKMAWFNVWNKCAYECKQSNGWEP